MQLSIKIFSLLSFIYLICLDLHTTVAQTVFDSKLKQHFVVAVHSCTSAVHSLVLLESTVQIKFQLQAARITYLSSLQGALMIF